jgi:cytochrome P450
VQTIAMLWFMEPWVRRGRRLGSPRTVKVLGLGEVVSVWDPDMVRELFTGDSDVLHAGEANARVLGGVAPTSLLALDGERHVRMRRLLSPPFHGEAV